MISKQQQLYVTLNHLSDLRQSITQHNNAHRKIAQYGFSGVLHGAYRFATTEVHLSDGVRCSNNNVCRAVSYMTFLTMNHLRSGRSRTCRKPNPNSPTVAKASTQNVVEFSANAFTIVGTTYAQHGGRAAREFVLPTTSPEMRSDDQPYYRKEPNHREG